MSFVPKRLEASVFKSFFICFAEKKEMETSIEKAAVCALGKIFGFRPKTGISLMKHFGSAMAVFEAGQERIRQVMGPFNDVNGKLTLKEVEECMRMLERLSGEGVDFISINDESYPRLLKECDDPPLGLYVKSATPAKELWNDRRIIAVVGTRDLSSYGEYWCREIIKSLAECEEKPVIVSGLAIGTDICAHRAALEFGLPTIAVMPTGADSVYPKRHFGYAQRICSTEGCALVTDYPPGTEALAIHFLRRNRIIAALAEALILTESRIKGGGMMTARLAFSYNRDVYVLPGRIDDVRSQGCNYLVRNKIAEFITSAEDLLENIGMKRRKGLADSLSIRQTAERMYSEKMDGDKVELMSRLLMEIRSERDINVEELASRLLISYTLASRLTGMLESDGLIRKDLLGRCSINGNFV